MPEYCKSDGTCPDDAFEPDTTECTGEYNGDKCDAQDYCSGTSSDCVEKYKPADYVCRADAGECDLEEKCTGDSGACPDDAFEPSTKACGDQTDTVCTNPDTCSGIDNECLPNNQPCGYVTSSSLCSFDYDGTRPSHQFRTLFTAAADGWPAYKINATNPGQFFYNAIVQGPVGPTTITMDIPWPFVTQGAMPAHVYDSDAIDVVGNDPFCFLDNGQLPVNGTSYPAKITPEMRANGLHVTDEALGMWDVDCTQPGSMGAIYPPGVNGMPGYSCKVSIRFEMPDSGKAYVNIHLDYGVKGPKTDANPVDTLIDRYDVGFNTCVGDETYYDALTNVATPTTATPVALATCTQYPFGHTTSTCSPLDDPVCSGADSVENVNVFKKFVGIATQATMGGGPWGKVPVSFWKAGQQLEAGTTDDDGYYAFLYKHTGKAANYVVKFGAPVNAEATVQLKGNGWATATYMYNTETKAGTWYTDWK